MGISRFPLRPWVDLKNISVADFKLSHLQRSLSTPTNHCGGNASLKVRFRTPAASGPALCPRKMESFGAGSDPPNAQRRLSGV
jgi:hypothetical protein